MIQNPSLIFYACVAKGTTVLAEFNSKDADLGTLAAKCLEKTPPFHSSFSHTIRNKTYRFLIDDPFTYFGVFDESVDRSDGLSFLNSVKDAFNEVVESNTDEKRMDSLNSHCFQGDFNPVFHKLLASPSDLDALTSPRADLRTDHGHSGSLDSARGKMIGSTPLLGDSTKSLKKKKKRFFGMRNGESNDGVNEDKLDVSDATPGLNREFSVVMHHKNGLFAADLGHQKAKRAWNKQVWVVLLLDLLVCSILFAVWLWICRGFKCIDG